MILHVLIYYLNINNLYISSIDVRYTGHATVSKKQKKEKKFITNN